MLKPSPRALAQALLGIKPQAPNGPAPSAPLGPGLPRREAGAPPPRMVQGLAPEQARRIAESDVGAPQGARLGWSPIGGAAAVHDSAPEHVRIAATGPGLAGALNRPQPASAPLPRPNPLRAAPDPNVAPPGPRSGNDEPFVPNSGLTLPDPRMPLLPTVPLQPAVRGRPIAPMQWPPRLRGR